MFVFDFFDYSLTFVFILFRNPALVRLLQKVDFKIDQIISLFLLFFILFVEIKDAADKFDKQNADEFLIPMPTILQRRSIFQTDIDPHVIQFDIFGDEILTGSFILTSEDLRMLVNRTKNRSFRIQIRFFKGSAEFI